MGIYFYKPKFSRELDPFIRLLLCNVIFAHWKWLQTHLLGAALNLWEVQFSNLINDPDRDLHYLQNKTLLDVCRITIWYIEDVQLGTVFVCRHNLIPNCLEPVSVYRAFQNIHIHQSSWQFIYKAVALFMLARIDKQLSGQTSMVEINIATSRHSFLLISPRNPLKMKHPQFLQETWLFTQATEFCACERDKWKEGEFKRANREWLSLSLRSRATQSRQEPQLKQTLSSPLFCTAFPQLVRSVF